MTPAWWGRSLHYAHTLAQEPIGVVLAMQSTQEGQQPALNTEVVLPAFARHYGYPAGSPEIEFFTEHAEADIEHSQRQAALCAKYLDTEAVKARALEVAEAACMLRWASITDLYRRDYLGGEGHPAGRPELSGQALDVVRRTRVRGHRARPALAGPARAMLRRAGGLT